MLAPVLRTREASRSVLAVAAALLCLSLTGCGGQSTPSAHSGGTLPSAGSPASQPQADSAGPGPSHPCALLTQAEAAAANSGNGPPSPVSGVGDQALNHNGAGGSLLYIRKGSAGFALVLNGPNIDHLPDHGLAKEEALAALILPRL